MRQDGLEGLLLKLSLLLRVAVSLPLLYLLNHSFPHVFRWLFSQSKIDINLCHLALDLRLRGVLFNFISNQSLSLQVEISLANCQSELLLLLYRFPLLFCASDQLLELDLVACLKVLLLSEVAVTAGHFLQLKVFELDLLSAILVLWTKPLLVELLTNDFFESCWHLPVSDKVIGLKALPQYLLEVFLVSLYQSLLQQAIFADLPRGLCQNLLDLTDCLVSPYLPVVFKLFRLQCFEDLELDWLPFSYPTYIIVVL